MSMTWDFVKYVWGCEFIDDFSEDVAKGIADDIEKNYFDDEHDPIPGSEADAIGPHGDDDW